MSGEHAYCGHIDTRLNQPPGVRLAFITKHVIFVRNDKCRGKPFNCSVVADRGEAVVFLRVFIPTAFISGIVG